jgi:phosphatidylglycerol:prolipoprotein diacylglycerol transferase
MLWLAAVVGGLVMDRNFRRARISADAVGMVAITVIAGIVGAKLWHVLDTPSEFHEEGWRVLWDVGGFAWFGGLVAGISALLIQGVIARIGALKTLDLAAPAAAFGYGIGRIGCFLSGDGCYGIPTTLPWGMAFPKGIEPVYVPVHPTPLYELGGGLIIGTWLWFRGGKARPTGSILGEYLILTGLARFSVEFLRRNPHVMWGLSNAQLASIGSVAVGAAILLWASTRRKVTADQPSMAVEKTA